MIRNFARLAAASFIAALLSASVVLAQNAGTVTNHAFAIGKGAGKSSYTSLLCGSGQIALGQSSADPICRTMSGDATIDAAGALAIGANKVTNSMLRQSGALAVVGRSANSTGNVADIQATAASDAVLRENGSTIGFGTIATGGIANNAVTDAKLRQGGALSLIGRSANSTGNVADIQATAASDAVLRESGSAVGFGAIATGGIANNAVTDAKLRQGGALSLIGRSANSTGNVADISASAGSSCAFRESSNAIACGTLATAAYAANSVTNAKLAQMANATFKCRTTAGTGDPEDCTATQATALLNAVVGDSGSGGTKGLVPAPGAGDAAAGKFLKADGTFAVPPGSGGSGATDPQRQNALLVGIYQSKSFAGYRRVVNEFYDGFKASDGINAGSSSGYTLNTSSGFVAPTVTLGSQISGGTGTNIGNMTGGGGLAAAFDGTTSQSSAAAAAGSAGSAANVGKNYSASPKQLYQVTVFSSNGTGTVVWNTGNNSDTLTFDWRASHTSPSNFQTDGVSLGTTTDSNGGGATRSKTIASNDQTTAWEYTWIYMTSSAQAGGSLIIAEVQFFPSSIANETLVTTSQTADSTVSNGRVLIEFDNSGSPTLNTDLTVEISCDNGSHWTSASLSAVTSNSQGGRKVAETVDQAAGTSGTSFAARIKTLNNKSVPIYGVSLTVH